MRLLVDESVESAIESLLRAEGHDLVSIAEEMPGSDDTHVLGRATLEGRILITNDKDFAELAFRQRSASAGIVLVRLPRASSAVKARRVGEVFRDHGALLAGSLTVVEASAIRIRPLPGPMK
jgi:predicted nuclease of predicted toxin-antitoxin system